MELERQSALPMARAGKPIWSNGRFLVLWLASGLTNLAFSVYLLTESWYVVQRLHLESWLGIVMMTTTIPRVVLMSFAGVLADRVRKTSILFWSNGTRAVLIAALVFCAASQTLNIWGLLAFALAFGILDAFFWPADSSLLPNIVDREQLARGNSILQTTNQLSALLGPALAGYLMKFASFEASFAFAAGFLLLSAVTVRFLRRGEAAAEGSARPPFLRQMKDGFAYVRSFPYLLSLMSVFMVVNLLFSGPLSVGVPVLVQHALHGDVLALSYMESAIAVGMLAGAALVGIVQPKRRRAQIALASVVLLGVGMAVLSRIGQAWQGIATMFAIGLIVSFINVMMSTLIQQSVKIEMMGRVQGLMSTASTGLVPVSFAIVSSLLGAGVPISDILLGGSLMLVAFTIAVLLAAKSVRQAD